MIIKLQHKDIEVAKRIRAVFQLSYKIEAKLLGAKEFPPLKRKLTEYINSDTAFYGYFNEDLIGVIETEHNNLYTHINSLVVHPNHFRQGIARQLLEFTFVTFDSTLFVVETGLKNDPAISLYKKFGFKEVKQWDTNHGVRKIKFEYSAPN